MVGQVPCKCEGLASGRRAQGLSTHKSGQWVGRPAAGRTHPARQRLLQGGRQGRPHPHIQGPRSGPSPRRHPPEGTPGRGRAVGRRPSLRRPVLGAAGPRVRGTRYAQRLPCCRARETHAACRPRRMPSRPPPGGTEEGWARARHRERPRSGTHPPPTVALGPAQPVPPLQEPRDRRTRPLTPRHPFTSSPQTTQPRRGVAWRHTRPRAQTPHKPLGGARRPATPWGGRISQEKRLVL